MTINGIIQILLFLTVLTLLAKPMGIYLLKVYNGDRTVLSYILGPVERFIYRITLIEPVHEMNWKRYGAAMIAFSFVSSPRLYALHRLQLFLTL